MATDGYGVGAIPNGDGASDADEDGVAVRHYNVAVACRGDEPANGGDGQLNALNRGTQSNGQPHCILKSSHVALAVVNRQKNNDIPTVEQVIEKYGSIQATGKQKNSSHF